MISKCFEYFCCSQSSRLIWFGHFKISRYKDDKKCSRLIAEALDPEGKITAVQIYCKLKQLGLQTTRSKKLACVDVPLPAGDDPTEEAGVAFTNTPKGNENDSYLKTSM